MIKLEIKTDLLSLEARKRSQRWENQYIWLFLKIKGNTNDKWERVDFMWNKRIAHYNDK